MTGDLVLTPRELAERWKVSPGHLANWRSEGRGPTYRKIGKSVRYLMVDIETFEQRHAFTARFDLAEAGVS